MDTEWLDYIDVEGGDGYIGPNLEEILCCSRGRGVLPRTVPRLPLIAAIQRMKLLEREEKTGKDDVPTLVSDKSSLVQSEAEASVTEKLKTTEAGDATLSYNTDTPENRTVKPKKFDFTKANQDLLEEFPLPKKPKTKIYSLTQKNLEKFLRESDTESSCSSQGPISHNASLEYAEDLPLYQRYPVTLDDISKSKISQVPPRVENLLYAMDKYIDNSCDHFESSPNVNETPSHVVPEEFSRGSYAAQFISEPEHKSVDLEPSDASVVCDQSDLSSPSDNVDEEVGNKSVDIHESQSTDIPCQISYNIKCVPVNNEESASCIGQDERSESLVINTENDIQIDETEVCVNGAIELNTVEGNSEHTSTSSQLVTENECDLLQKIQVGNSIDKRDSTINGDWRLHGKNVIQIDGLPHQCDFTELLGVVNSFGTVMDYQVRPQDSVSCVRFRLNSEDACKYAVQCLDNTDCLFPDNSCKLTCFELQT